MTRERNAVIVEEEVLAIVAIETEVETKERKNENKEIATAKERRRKNIKSTENLHQIQDHDKSII